MIRPPWVEDMLGVWYDQGPYPLRSTDDVAHLVAWVKTLEQRNQAAQAHIDRARAHLDDWRATELVCALDVLRGEAGA